MSATLPAMKVMVQPGDEELLRRMITGDVEAFEALYDRRQAGVYRFALRMCGSAALAEDITQDVFIALMRDGHQFDPARGTVAGYLFGMTRHRVLRRLQKERTMVTIGDGVQEDETQLPDEQLSGTSNPLHDLSRQELIESVRQAVLALPLHYREVVVLCNLDEMSYEQAASIIGCPVGTVRSRLNRARAMLADKLRAWQPAEELNARTTSVRYEL